MYNIKLINMKLDKEKRLRTTHELVEIYDSLIMTWNEVKKIKEGLAEYEEEKRLLLECGLIMNILRPLCDTRRYSLLHENKYEKNNKEGVEKDKQAAKQ